METKENALRKRHSRRRSPVADYIAGTLEQRIRTGAYPGGKWLPTERDLAHEFQVSRGTIRSALAELSTRELVTRSAGCRAFVHGPESSIKPGAARARRNLALWISGDPMDMGGAMTTRGIYSELDPEEYRLVLAHHSGSTLDALIESEAQFLERLAGDGAIAGVLLWYFGGERNLSALNRLRSAGVPVVFVDRTPPAAFPADYVGVMNEKAACDVMAHLVSLGHTRIAHVTNPELASTVEERLLGYKRGLAEAGIPFDESLVYMGRLVQEATDSQAGHYTRLVNTLTALANPPTAIFAVNDFVAQCVIEALREHNIRVPEQMAVAGFDDMERWLPGRTFVTTVRQPFERLGVEAVRLLLERVEQGPTQCYKHMLLDAPVVARESTRGRREGAGVKLHYRVDVATATRSGEHSQESRI